ncbi:O-antigen ligase domain-containing protein [Candidatus Parcubacteria bacterium]|nr:MAG: O-antigen ligase domain-containing protein [Candidatus Parcubacteria bacterium]
MLKRIERAVFFFAVFFLPFQAGKHFWPDFSFVGGLRVDYLSPTLHATDILIILLFLMVVLEWIRGIRRIRVRLNLPFSLVGFYCGLRGALAVGKGIRIGRRIIFFLVFLFLLIFPFFFASSPEAVIFGGIKFLEFSFFAIYIAKKLSFRDKDVLIDSLSIGAIIVSFIAIIQFLKQGSVGGFLYLLGERTFTSSTIGIANMSLDGALILRSYSTFPHPNILAFFLFMVVILAFFKVKNEKDLYEKIFLMITLLISAIALFLTFSRTVIICFLLFAVYYFVFSFKKKKVKMSVFTLLFLGVVVTISYFVVYSSRFFDFDSFLQGFVPRQDLLNVAMLIFRESPIVVGVGINNFYIHEILYQKNISSTLLQPVHNIYALVLVEIGLLGLLGFLGFFRESVKILLKKIIKYKRKELKDFYKGVLVLMVSIMFVGFFDHFFLTLQQGQMMLALIIGLAWSRTRN